MSQIGKTLKQVTKQLSPQRKSRKQNRRRPNQRRRFRNQSYIARVGRGPSGILAGYGSPLQATYSARTTPDGCIVSGFDLVTSEALHDCISYYMPANPLWWEGTRISAQARAYQNYRPLKFIIHYRPQVGSTSELSLFIGTIWQGNSINDFASVEPSLVTSPGGVYLPSWNDSMTHVQCGRHLPQRMFPVNDKHFTTVPFTVVARSSSGGPMSPADLMPGRIFIEYAYEFRNAIGGQAVYKQPRVLDFYFGADRTRDNTCVTLGQSLSATESYNWDNFVGTYRGRVMDVRGPGIMSHFGINSEVSFTFTNSDRPMQVLVNGKINYLMGTAPSDDSNADFSGLPMWSQVMAETGIELSRYPRIVVFCTDYPTHTVYNEEEL